MEIRFIGSAAQQERLLRVRQLRQEDIPREKARFSPAKLTAHTLLMMRRLQEPRLHRNIQRNIHMFYRPAEAYASVDRELLGTVHAGVGVPQTTSPFHRRFYDAMRARVQMDNGNYSERFEISQGLHKRCVLPSLRFVFFPVCCILF